MYIVFEGIVKTGKTTQSKKLAEYLQTKFPKKKITWTREPGGTEIADTIRKLVQATEFKEDMDPICEAYLYAASRAQSLRKIVKPNLSKSNFVIADRSFITSMVYQGYVRKASVETILEINKNAISNILPDLVFFLDINVETALTRINDKEGDKWEKLDQTFFNKARSGYKKLAKIPMFKNKWHTINSNKDIESVFNQIKEVVDAKF